MKKLLVAVLVVFFGFWLFTDPNGLAASSKTAGGSAWSATESLFEAVINFLRALS